ncbi:hypothetical protein ShirakiTB12_54430 [Priestia megaterium]|uniref:Lipoprotein n=1 Tax=Priestia megaterium TaxID=1404 RepID=A0AAX6BTC0_PRIMG|nr:hypothetical protein [Priestia megaterium]GMG76974.1 hypothetical protein ShirakiTB12_54430 [Priestia megaterium]
MKKILAFISIISIVSVLASCGNKETSTEPKPKTCEQIEPCKTALKYATYVEQGAEDKLYKMEDQTGKHRSYDSLEEAKVYIAEDYDKYKNQKIENYGAIEYVISTNKKYIYKFRYKDFRTEELKNTTVGISKQGDRYFANEYYSGATKQDITVNGKITKHKRYYSSGLDQQVKEAFAPDPIEQY